MEKTEEFSLEISKGALFWLMQALGKVDVVLPGNPFCSLTPAELNVCLDQGRMELIQHGLIRPTASIGVEIDRFIASLVEWLSAPERLVLIQVLRSQAEARTAGLYSRAEKSLLLEFVNDCYHLLLFQEDESLWTHCRNLFGVPITIEPNPGPTLRLPEPIPILSLFWRDSQAAHRALQVCGLPPSEISVALDCLRDWKSLTQLTFFRAQKGELRLVGMRFLASNGAHLWSTTLGKTGTKEFLFAPVVHWQ